MYIERLFAPHWGWIGALFLCPNPWANTRDWRCFISPVGSIQYELIDRQFDCMAKYLSWDMLFKKSYYATARDELEKNKDSMNELEWIGKNL